MAKVIRSPDCRCGAKARPGQYWCWECHAAYMRQYRKAHKLFGHARKRANSRTYLKTYVKRRKVLPQPCEVCGDTKVQAHHDDYAKPLQVRWLCLKHHHELHGKTSHVQKDGMTRVAVT